MAGWTLLALALIGAGLVANAARPSRSPKWLVPSWLAVFLTTDLVFHHIVLQIIVVAVFAWLGALATVTGKVAVVLMIVSTLVLLRLWLPALKARDVADRTAAHLRLDEVEPVPASLLLAPFPAVRKGVKVERDVEFFRVAGRSLKLDVFSPDVPGEARPVLIYVHGGGWVFGDKRDQGLPLVNHLATLGWVCFNVNYRLSPGATWPDQLVDVKAAIAWIRDHADDFGIDAGFVAIAGGSAGAQIASMAAVTQGDRELQPGFEDADTSLQAIATSYGIYDLTNRLGVHNPDFVSRMVGPLVIKAFLDEEPEKFRAASPRDHVERTELPWLVLHGSDDELVPVAEARDFFEALSADSSSLCGYAELPGASHAFDIYYCHRAIAAVDLTSRFLATALSSSKAASRQSA